MFGWLPKARRAGFSLLELLIVIAIILMLMSLSLTVFNEYKTIGRKTTTKAFLGTIRTALTAYEFDFGKYPPDAVVLGGQTCRGGALLVYHLTTAFRTLPNAARKQVWAAKDAGPYLDVPADYLKDLNHDGLPLLVDAWGQPIQYDNIRDDLVGNGFTFCGPDDPRSDGRPHNFESFDLFSPGVPGRNEPIANFQK